MSGKRKAASKDQDFPKKKQKLGKRKLKPTNHTSISFKSKTIQLTTQNLRSNDVIASNIPVAATTLVNDEATAKDFVTRRNLSLGDITNQFNHYNLKIQATALKSMLELIVLHPHVLQQNMSTIIHSTCPFIVHDEAGVRKELKRLLEYLFATITENAMRPFISLYVTHVTNALTSMKIMVRNFGLKVLQMLLDHYESQCAQYAAKILPNLYNVFQMRSAGISYKGKNHKAGQELSACILDRYLGILMEYNKLKIPNYWKDDDRSIYYHHTHDQKLSANSEMDQQKEFMFKSGEVLSSIAFTFNSLEKQKMQTLHRIIQRKIADKSKIILESGSGSTKSQQRTTEATSDATNQGGKSNHHVLMLSEDVSNYSLESEQSLTLLINKFSSPIVDLYLEFLNSVSSSILHNVLHAVYQLLYAMEHLSNDVVDQEKMQKDFSFYKYMKRKGEVETHFGSSGQMSCRAAWIGITSFFDVEETIVQLLSIFCKNSFSGNSKDLGILLGAFWRVREALPDDVELALWKGLTNIFLNEKHLSDNQKLILQFFANTVLKNQKMVPPEIVFQIWAKQLPVLLSKVNSDQIQESKYLVATLSAFSKSLHQKYLTPDSLFPLFLPEFFLALPNNHQTSLLYLLFHTPDTKIPQTLLKGMSQICTHETCEIGVASVLIEFVSLQQGLTAVEKSTFLLSVLCGRPDLIQELVVAFSNIEDCLERIAGFLTSMLSKQIGMNLRVALFTLLYNAMVWKYSKQENGENSKAVSTLMTTVLPTSLFSFMKQCFVDQSYIRHASLCVNLCSLNQKLMTEILTQLSALKESVALDICLTLLKSFTTATVQENKVLWSTIYKNLNRFVAQDLKDNSSISHLNAKFQQVHSQMILHQLIKQ